MLRKIHSTTLDDGNTFEARSNALFASDDVNALAANSIARAAQLAWWLVAKKSGKYRSSESTETQDSD